MDAETKAAMERLRISGGDVVGSHTPSYYCDLLAVARLALAEHPVDDDEPATDEWLESQGWLPDYDGEKRIGVAKKIWEVGETDDNGEEPAMHVLFADGSLWLEAYGVGGDTLCLLEIIRKPTNRQVRRLIAALEGK